MTKRQDRSKQQRQEIEIDTKQKKNEKHKPFKINKRNCYGFEQPQRLAFFKTKCWRPYVDL